MRHLGYHVYHRPTSIEHPPLDGTIHTARQDQLKSLVGAVEGQLALPQHIKAERVVGFVRDDRPEPPAER